jgi:hypothetical protein
MKKLSAACMISHCPGVYDPEDGSGDLIVIGKNAVFSEAYMNSELAAGRDEVALTISRDLLVAISSCPACEQPKLIRNGELIQCKGCGHIADELPSIKSKRLIEALELILPMAKGYAHANNVGNNLAFIRSAEEALASCKSEL